MNVYLIKSWVCLLFPFMLLLNIYLFTYLVGLFFLSVCFSVVEGSVCPKFWKVYLEVKPLPLITLFWKLSKLILLSYLRTIIRLVAYVFHCYLWLGYFWFTIHQPRASSLCCNRLIEQEIMGSCLLITSIPAGHSI